MRGQVRGEREDLVASIVETLEQHLRLTFVFLRVPPEVGLLFEFLAAVATLKPEALVLSLGVFHQIQLRFIGEGADSAVQQSLVVLDVRVLLVGVFAEVVAILEQLVAAWPKTLDDAGRPRLVTRQVQLVISFTFGVLTAHQASVGGGTVHFDLVQLQLLGKRG